MGLGNLRFLCSDVIRQGLNLATHGLVGKLSLITLRLEGNPAQDELPQICSVLLVSLVRLMHRLKGRRRGPLRL